MSLYISHCRNLNFTGNVLELDPVGHIYSQSGELWNIHRLRGLQPRVKCVPRKKQGLIRGGCFTVFWW